MPHFFITFSETRIYSAMPLFMRVLVFSVSYFLTEKWKIFSCFLRGFPTSTTKNTTKILNENTKKNRIARFFFIQIKGWILLFVDMPCVHRLLGSTRIGCNAYVLSPSVRFGRVPPYHKMDRESIENNLFSVPL